VVNLLYENEAMDEAADSVLRQSADVVVLSEFTPEHQATLGDHDLAADFPHRIEREGWGAGGIAIWSRYPMSEGVPLPTRNYSLDVTVSGPDGPVALIGVHAATPIFDFDAWQTDLAVVGRRTGAANGPTMVVGDFNASYWHPDFRDLLDDGFVDAHMAHGSGFSASWPMQRWFPPFVRLDHALTGGGLVSTAVSDFDVPGSDHRGFVVTVAPAER
ncbi:MAG: endonuclease/exonuclease/phosphatase family protein, partial [Ilumatobacteraceae bacterium]